MNLLKKLLKKTVIFDGGMGTMLQNNGIKYTCPEELVLTHPEVVSEIHKQYADAGAEVITTNTFGANKIKLSHYGLEDKVREINSKAVELAKQTGKYVAASVGPTGKLMGSLGELIFDEAYEAFYEQIKAQAEADAILIETMQDVHEAKAAVIAAQEFKLPLIVSFTFEKNLRTLTGSTPEGVATIFENLVDIIGVNCGVSLENTCKIVKQYYESTNKPILAQPNMPLHEKISAKQYSEKTAEYIKVGAAAVGGCCGTTPEITKLLVEATKNKKPLQLPKKIPSRIASRSQVLKFEGQTKIIGERINTTGKKWLKKALKEENYARVVEEAHKQIIAGADALDVNLQGPNETEHMSAVITEISSRLDVPLFIDSADPKVIEAGLKAYPGKAVINSVNGRTIDKIIPLAKKYGASVVALAMDEQGIPEKAKERLEVIEKISKASLMYTEDILADCLTLALGAEQEKTFETIKAVNLAKEKGYTTVLGVSNVSFKMPNRELLNSAFLSMAIAAGLDAAITDPTNENITGSLYASLALTGKDKGCIKYLEQFGNKLEEKAATLEEKIWFSVVNGEKENIQNYVEEALTKYKPFEIIDNLLIPAITEVGEKFDKGTFYLPQLMLSSETMYKGLERAKREIKQSEQKTKGTIVLATVEGDLHDLGKTIVKIVMETNGYEVIDLGRDVKAEKIVKELKKTNANYLGLSALLTTTAEKMRDVVELARAEGIESKILIGGAAASEEFAKDIGAHAYCKTPFDALKKLK